MKRPLAPACRFKKGTGRGESKFSTLNFKYGTCLHSWRRDAPILSANLKKEGQDHPEFDYRGWQKKRRSMTRRLIRRKFRQARLAISTPVNSPSNCISARFIPEIDREITWYTNHAYRKRLAASGALSVLLGAHWIMGGFHDAVLVVGAEQQKTMSSLDGSDVLGAGRGLSHRKNPRYGDFMCSEIVRPYRARFTIEKSMALPKRTLAWGRLQKLCTRPALNPLAQMREADLNL